MNDARRTMLAAACASALSACGGSSGQVLDAPGGGATGTPAKTTLVTGTFLIPVAAKAAGAAGRRRAYVPPTVRGLVVRVDQVSGGVAAEYSDTGYVLDTNLSTMSANSACKSAGASAIECTIAFVAPVTDATNRDNFYIYAYDQAQTAGPVTATYVPAGSLLAQDVGGGNGDQVPSSNGGANTAGIATGVNTSLSFTLSPVVATPLPGIGAVAGSAGTTLVLSAPGQGGLTNSMTIDGSDADQNTISTYLSGTTLDSDFVNPVSLTAAPLQFVPAVSTVATIGQSVAVRYTPLPSDQPASPTATPLEGTVTLSDSFFGGFHNTSSFPNAKATVTVAPLYAVATQLTGTTMGYNIYALAAALPTAVTGAASYALAATPTVSGSNDCSPYTQSTIATSGGDQRAAFEVAFNILSASMTPCTFVLTDGLVQTTITLASPL